MRSLMFMNDIRKEGWEGDLWQNLHMIFIWKSGNGIDHKKVIAFKQTVHNGSSGSQKGCCSHFML